MEMPCIGRWLSILAFIILIASAKAEIVNVCQDGCHHHSIQEAVDAASEGDMISVESGIYPEAVNLSKRLTLRGVDTGGGKPLIVNNSSIITLSANRSVVDGFSISGSKEAGIKVHSWGNTLLGNDLHQNSMGIDVQSGENIITRNNVSDNDLGIEARNASENILTFNNISHNRLGITLTGANANVVRKNTVSQNEGYGMMLQGSDFNVIAGNAVKDNILGIGLNESKNNTLIGNNITENALVDVHGASLNCWDGNLYGAYDMSINNESCGREHILQGGMGGVLYSNLSLMSSERNLIPNEAYTLMQENRDLIIIDVRTPEEHESGHLEGAINMDYYSYGFLSSLKSLDKNSTYIVYCRRGYRGGVALEMMTALGFKEVYNILGGMTQWAEEGMPMIGEVMQ
jgi:parallel beta-helix repeat protein